MRDSSGHLVAPPQGRTVFGLPFVVATMFLAMGLLSAGYGVMFTVLDEFREKLGVGEGAVGLIVAIGFFTSFAAQIGLAPLADRGHARTLLILGLSLAVVGTLAMGFGRDLWFVLLARIVMGVGTGMAIPAARRVVILADPDNLGRNMGRVLAIDVAGFATGPVVSALTVGSLGLPAPFVIMGTVLALCIVVIVRTKVEDDDAPIAASSQRLAFDLLRIRPLAGAIVMGLAVFVMIGTFDALWSLVMEDMNAREWIASVGISIFALPLVFLGPLGGRLAQERGPLRLSTYGLVAGAAFMALYGLLPEASLMLGVGVIHGINDGLTVTGTGVAVGMYAPPERTAAAQGLLGGMQVLMGGIASLGAGLLYEAFGRTTTYLACGSLMLALVGLGAWLAGPEWGRRPSADDAADLVPARSSSDAALVS